MTDTSPPKTRQPEPPAHQGGFRLRLFLLIVTPAALLAIGGAYLLYSLAPRDSAFSDFLPAYLTAAGLAVALATVLAWAADLALRNHLAAIERTLAQGSRGTESLASVERQWVGLRRLARAAHDAISRVDDRSQDAEELKALQGAADDLLEKIRVWSETEIAPSFDAAGPLSEVLQALGTLARHLEERSAEAREVAELARQSVGEAYEGIERANRESSRSAREIAALLTASAEVKRLAADLTARFREPVPVTAIEPAPVAKEPELGPELELWRVRVASLASRLESLERLALRAALELAAEGIAERREAGPWLDRVETLRHVALGARALREESKAIATETAAALLSSLRTAAAPAPLVEATAAIPGELVAMAERVEQWGSDAHSRSERLSALSQRLANEFAAATGLARAGVDELAGLAARFTSRAAVAEVEETEVASETSWPAGARPLRLLTREDVLPDEDDVTGAAEGTPRDG